MPKLEINNEYDKYRDEHFETRRAPKWAWDIIDENLDNANMDPGLLANIKRACEVVERLN